jgi:hypothetical protein
VLRGGGDEGFGLSGLVTGIVRLRESSLSGWLTFPNEVVEVRASVAGGPWRKRAQNREHYRSAGPPQREYRAVDVHDASASSGMCSLRAPRHCERLDFWAFCLETA